MIIPDQRKKTLMDQTRAVAAQFEDDARDLEALRARYDDLGGKAAFDTDLFSVPQEISSDELLAVFNAWNALTATPAWAPLKAALSKARR